MRILSLHGAVGAILLAPVFSAYAVVVVDAAVTQPSQAGQQQVQPQSQVQAQSHLQTESQVQTPPQPAAKSTNAELLYQLQLLQEEVMSIRGALEEQQHELSVLKQQRLDDYVDFDRRLSGFNPSSSQATHPAGNSFAASGAEPVQSQQEKQDYNAAYELVKQRKLVEAKPAFLAFIKKYPQSSYIPNANYWMGALLFIDGDFLKSKGYFEKITSSYPEHVKYPEALYKIAEINYELGDRTAAKLQMEGLIKKYSKSSGEDSDAIVRKARAFLQEHYP